MFYTPKEELGQILKKSWFRDREIYDFMREDISGYKLF